MMYAIYSFCKFTFRSSTHWMNMKREMQSPQNPSVRQRKSSISSVGFILIQAKAQRRIQFIKDMCMTSKWLISVLHFQSMSERLLGESCVGYVNHFYCSLFLMSWLGFFLLAGIAEVHYDFSNAIFCSKHLTKVLPEHLKVLFQLVVVINLLYLVREDTQ